jgi:hypothetical protein
MHRILWPTIDIHILLDRLRLCLILTTLTTAIKQPESSSHAKEHEEFYDRENCRCEHSRHQRGPDVVVPLLRQVWVQALIKKGYPVQDRVLKVCIPEKKQDGCVEKLRYEDARHDGLSLLALGVVADEFDQDYVDAPEYEVDTYDQEGHRLGEC